MNPIPAMTEEDRQLRADWERTWLKQTLAKMNEAEQDPAELCKLMHHYAQLKKEDNAHDKNLVSFTIAQARLARRSPPEQSRAVPSPVSSGSALLNDSNTPLAVENPEWGPSDPDVDPEWIAAPWGRRKNGEPRTENEYRTILHRAVRDIYGLSLTDSGEKHRPDRIPAAPNPCASDSRTPDSPASSSTAPLAAIHPISTTPNPTSSILTPAIEPPVHPPAAISTFNFQLSTFPTRSPPDRREVSPFCNPDAPFDPKPTNPWRDF